MLFVVKQHHSKRVIDAVDSLITDNLDNVSFVKVCDSISDVVDTLEPLLVWLLIR